MKKNKRILPRLIILLIVICLVFPTQVSALEDDKNNDFVLEPIKDAPICIAGFLGTAERGPTVPKLVTSWAEYEKIYGAGGSDYGYLSDTVKSFFDNGGMNCYIARIVCDSAKTAMANITFDNMTTYKVEAVGEGKWGNSIFIKVIPSKKGISKEPLYDIEVSYKKGTISLPSRMGSHIESDLAFSVGEEYYNISLNKYSEHYIEKCVNGISNLVVFKKEEGIKPRDRKDSTYHLEGGSDGTGITCKEDFIRKDTLNSDYSKGLAALSKCEDISILYSPNSQSIQGLTEALVAECEGKKDRFLIIDSLQGDRNPNPRGITKSKYAAFYYPWIKIHDSSINSEKFIPPGGAVAGAIAKNDKAYGIHKAPADKPMSGIIGLEFAFDRAEIDKLKQDGVNPIVNMAGRGIVINGAYTLSEDAEYKYINVARTVMFLADSINEGTKWAIGKENDQFLWNLVNMNIENYLHDKWREGVLVGSVPHEAYFTRVDRSVMTENDIAENRLIGLVGVSIMRPAEFITFYIKCDLEDNASAE